MKRFAPFSTNLIILLALVLGAYWRLDAIGTTLLFGDEQHALQLVNSGYGEILTSFDWRGTHILMPLLQRATGDVLGPSIWTYRLPSIIAGILSLVLAFVLARRLVGEAPAILVTLALASSPIHIYYSRFARSYALTLLLGLVLALALEKMLRSRPAGRICVLTAVASAALLPYSHLTGLGLLVGLVPATLVLAWCPRRARRDLLLPTATFAAAGLLCAALYFPAWQSLESYLTNPKLGSGPLIPIGVLDVSTLLAGSRAAGIFWPLAAALGGAALLWKRPRAGTLVVGGALGPVLSLLAIRPYGMAYAYARYLFLALPFFLMLGAWFWVASFRAAWRGPIPPERAAVAAGVLLLAVAYFTGAASPLHTHDGPFRHSSLSLRPLPAFDVPYAHAPAFYQRLAETPGEVGIVEAPYVVGYGILLYRNYYLRHGKQVSIGYLGDEPLKYLVNGPYVWLEDPDLGKNLDADYLILHRNVGREIQRYLKFVYAEAYPKVRERTDASFMVRHRTVNIQRGPLPELEEQLRQRLGVPIVETPTLLVWSLAEPGSAGEVESSTREGP